MNTPNISNKNQQYNFASAQNTHTHTYKEKHIQTHIFLKINFKMRKIKLISKLSFSFSI